MAARIDRQSWEVPALFRALEATGGVRSDEMWRTFNMGIGMVVVVPAADAAAGWPHPLPAFPFCASARSSSAAAGQRVILGQVTAA